MAYPTNRVDVATVATITAFFVLWLFPILLLSLSSLFLAELCGQMFFYSKIEGWETILIVFKLHHLARIPDPIHNARFGVSLKKFFLWYRRSNERRLWFEMRRWYSWQRVQVSVWQWITWFSWKGGLNAYSAFRDKTCTSILPLTLDFFSVASYFI